MTHFNSIVGIYDFEIFPFALGDVLTWNVRTAIRCEELGREYVDVYICADSRYPAGVHQRGIVSSQNFDLFFSELYSAFGTNPRLGNIYIFRQRDDLIARLIEVAAEDDVNTEAVNDYLRILNYRVIGGAANQARRQRLKNIRGSRFIRTILKRFIPQPVKNKIKSTLASAFLPNEEVIANYFVKYIHSHESINDFAARHGRIPLLEPSLGCVPDVDELVARRFAGKKLVSFHLRLRRLDAGYGGGHSYSRDSDFLEWYDFLKEASEKYPDIEFVALGRLQEKPLELLRLPNVTSLRIFGMGLGHELTLMLRSDLFIGTSSGFAALANFSSIPYFITKMTAVSCKAYEIREGAERLPFAFEQQKLIYENETSELLMNLLGSRFGPPTSASNQPSSRGQTTVTANIDVSTWLNGRLQLMNSSATTSRFFNDERYRHAETAYMLLLSLESARQALLNGNRNESDRIFRRIEKNFPDLSDRMPQYVALKEIASKSNMSTDVIQTRLKELNIQVSGFVGKPCSASASHQPGWIPANWAISGESKPLADGAQPALQVRSPNSCWRTGQFVSTDLDGKITVRFDARNSEFSSLSQIFLHEDGICFPVCEVFVEPEWKVYEIPMTTKPGSILELQIDQRGAEQWFSLRNFNIVGGAPVPIVAQDPIMIPMDRWTGSVVPSEPVAGQDGVQWPVAGKSGYMRSPPLPQPGDGGMLIRFEARTDRSASTFTSAYLFEGEQYKKVAQFGFGTDWREFTLLLNPGRATPNKVQLDYPEAVDWLSIRNFRVIPIETVGRLSV